jgi:glycosyltransferase involved in cell wall biosynthesis
VVDEAHFFHPEVNKRHHKFWSSTERSHEDTLWIKNLTEFFHKHITRFVKEFGVDVFVPQNLFSYPLNIPLTMAVSEYVAENATPVIAHHHDFYWERKLFKVNSVWDYLTMIFPPTLNPVQHVVINTSARHQLATRKGLAATIIPNVMDFENPAPESDDYSKDIRERLELEPDEKLILQPTRVVQRKGIEHAIELISRLGVKARLVVSHATKDDEFGYNKRIREFADLLKVNMLFASHIIGEKRGVTEDGKKMYSLWDIYPFADLITYPSLFEGFGNAFLETIYFRKPIVVNNYTIYETDIRTKGFRVIFFNDFITDETVEQALTILNNPALDRENCEHNYALALKYFSYTVLREKIGVLLNNIYGH